MAEHKYDFEITMTCGGCSGAVDRVLKKLDGEFIPVASATQAPAVNAWNGATPDNTPTDNPQDLTPPHANPHQISPPGPR